jgi:hypothetical protein
VRVLAAFPGGEIGHPQAFHYGPGHGQAIPVVLVVLSAPALTTGSLNAVYAVESRRIAGDQNAAGITRYDRIDAVDGPEMELFRGLRRSYINQVVADFVPRQ